MNGQKLQAHEISLVNKEKLHYLDNRNLLEIRLQAVPVMDSVMCRSMEMYREAHERSNIA